jgi:hypothetical protein
MIWVVLLAIMSAAMPTGGPKRCDDGEMVPLLKHHEIQVLLTEPMASPTLRAARDLAARAQALRAAMRSYRASLRRALRHPLEDDIPF